MKLETRLAEFVRTAALPLPGERPALLALSGGLDSVTLLHILLRLGWPFAVAHCNFQLRGDESDGDEAFARDLAADAGLDFFVKKFDTQHFAHQNGFSIQMAARQLRYAWFEEIRQQKGFGPILTAHHLNDSVETALINLTRGTGLRGLGGLPVRQGSVLRPMLFATRDEVLQYAQREGLTWRNDSSNDSDEYTRNYIRRQVMPKFLALNPNFLHTAGRSLQRLRAADDNLDFFLRQLGETLPDGSYRIEKEKLANLPAPEEALRRLLKPYGFTAEQARQITEQLPETGRDWASESGIRLLNDRRALIVTQARQLPPPLRIEADDLMVKLPDNTRLVLTPSEAAGRYPDGRTAVLVDAGKLRFPLLLRPWQPGDVFQPLGMGSRHQKIQDFFTNQKVSRLDKEKAWVLADAGGAIIWLLGWRADERFKITETTRNALKISWIHELA